MDFIEWLFLALNLALFVVNWGWHNNLCRYYELNSNAAKTINQYFAELIDRNERFRQLAKQIKTLPGGVLPDLPEIQNQTLEMTHDGLRVHKGSQPS